MASSLKKASGVNIAKYEVPESERTQMSPEDKGKVITISLTPIFIFSKLHLNYLWLGKSDRQVRLLRGILKMELVGA